MSSVTRTDNHSVCGSSEKERSLAGTQLERIHFGTILGPKWAEGPLLGVPRPTPLGPLDPLGFRALEGKSIGLVADATPSPR